MRPISIFQFVFGFNECLWAIFSLLNLRKFLVLYLGCGCMTFNFTTQMTLSHFLPHADELKNLTAKTANYIQRSWEKSVKRKSNINFIRVIQKIHLLINIFYTYGLNLSKNYLSTVSCSPLLDSSLLDVLPLRFLVSSLAVQLYHVRHAMFQLFQY